jgi:hypothetical protein
MRTCGACEANLRAPSGHARFVRRGGHRSSRSSVAGIDSNGWDVQRLCPASRTGRKGAVEVFIHARRRPRR